MKPVAIPSSLFKENAVLPERESSIRLPAGTYVLGADSTCPFVRFEGSSFGEKTITWGEKVHIPDGENTRIFNASYHMGDIYLSNDFETYTRPARITIPFTWNIAKDAEPVPYNVNPAWNVPGLPLAKVDCRLARRVFAAVLIETGLDWEAEVAAVNVNGQHKLHSTTSGASLGGLPNGFRSPVYMAAASTLQLIPMGYYHPNDYSPMALLDNGWFDFTYVGETELIDYQGGYYIVEY